MDNEAQAKQNQQQVIRRERTNLHMHMLYMADGAGAMKDDEYES